MNQPGIAQWRKSLFDAGTLLLFLAPCLVAISFTRFSHVPVRGHIQEFGFYVTEAECGTIFGIVLSFFGKRLNRTLLVGLGLLEVWTYYALGYGSIA